MEQGIAAVVLAAGLSTRMGRFKPLLPLGGATVLGAAVASMRRAGVEEVVVVTGYRAGELARSIAGAGARAVHNPAFESGMYSSVRAGVAALSGAVEATLVLPCDIPLVSPDTIRALVARWRAHRPPVVHPVCGGRRGHPPLLDAAVLPEVLAGEPAGGLRGVLARHRGRAAEVVVDDPAIHWDADTPEAYERLSRAWRVREERLRGDGDR